MCEYAANGSHDSMAQSGRGFAGRYRRADMRVCPYDFHKFNGAKRERLCEYAANGSHNLVAQAVMVLQDGTVGQTCESAPTTFINLVAQSG